MDFTCLTVLQKSFLLYPAKRLLLFISWRKQGPKYIF